VSRPAGTAAAGRIAAAFAAARAAGRPALVPYVTAGDPDLATTGRIVAALARAGADVVELGVPFSDPIADGPVNQRSAERALRRGVNLRAVLALAADLRRAGAPPIVLFTYYNPIHRLGIETFAAEAGRAGVDGVLVTDLPPEEAGALETALRPAGVDLIFLLSPTSDPGRVAAIVRRARGFLYFISRTGTTGAREDLPPGLEAQVRAARAAAGGGLPIAVGFGIGGRAQVERAAGFADGVVVGSALVRLIEEAAGSPDLETRVEAFCRGLLGERAR
jgi:tryptophan synthase alpha chain